MSFELFNSVIEQVDNGHLSLTSFKEENLFMNNFYCYYFTNYLSPYANWGDNFIKGLKKIIRRKWSKDLPNVDFFLKQIDKQAPEIDPKDYYFNSEDYFTKLMFLKPISDILFPPEKKKKKKKIYKKKYILIR